MPMETLLQDLRYGVRMLRKAPAFSAIAIITLALGIGANTAMFSIVYGVLLRSLPIQDPDHVVIVYTKSPQWQKQSVSYPNYLDWKRSSRSFADMAAFRHDDMNLTGTGDPTRVHVGMVTADFFPVLGIQPLLGRNIIAQEDLPGGNPVVMLTDSFWKSQFAGDPGVLGRAITLNDVSYTIIGVVPPDGGIFTQRQAFVSLGAWRQPMMTDRGVSFGMRVVGRLKPGVTLQQASSEMASITHALAQQYPEQNKDRGATLVPVREDIVGDVRLPLIVLLAAVGFVLLIACANVANLMLARSAVRRHEFAVRSALGARPGRLIRQLLTEGLLLSIAGGTLGIALAAAINKLFLARSFDLPRATAVRLDGHVLLFTAILALLTSVIFGLAPAFQSTRADANQTLKDSGRASSARHHLQSALVIGEVALALVLTAAAGLMIRTIWQLWQVNPGFDSHNLIAFSVFGSPAPPSNPDAYRASIGALSERFRNIAGVQAASGLVGSLPFQGDSDVPFWVVGKPRPANQTQMPWTLFYYVDPQYRDAMRIPLLRGRFLTAQDVHSSPSVAVVDEELVRRYLPGEDPIGKHLHLELIGSEVEIVGVVGHVVQWGLDTDAQQNVRAELYLPMQQMPDGVVAALGGVSSMSYVLRTATPVGEIGTTVKRRLADFNARMAVSDLESMEQVVADSLQQRRFARLLLGAFAGLALLLAGVGIYGVMAYTVTERTRDIGIRMALGASARHVLGDVIRHALVMSAIGIAIGALAGFAVTRLMSGMLFQVRAWDPLTFVSVAFVLAAVGLLASYLPARRAAHVDPIVALRCE
jgi:predicted permease